MTPGEIVACPADAWNAGDGDRWAEAFAEDAVLVDVLGRIQRGRSVIAARTAPAADDGEAVQCYRLVGDTATPDSLLH
ncbi:hypothetical protein Ae168Ps1_6207c [Pseudonocardia sp. Ae168_Ps1]|uniref:SgcJ/EcaC family oxidoreductase n=1 Tax=unclassified Pseudonocardia TaxID=2619320 RepID=UPI00094B6543|nr:MULTISPECIES: SgcJ/EcaC family oxidoreductase [unclassified Pseudonocardia]OLL70460.1 hypothetical protein Ae168Ps1_6207c [Pseudonocardia sp. Ae168_Ps1]OLL71579.1 hypothetical protein Ae263Ps1_6067c [Pseudonocardia sp. Ae263_Ps1]